VHCHLCNDVFNINKVNKMEEHFINYNQAVSLKELGFDEPCFAKFNHQKKLEISYCLEKTCGYDKHKNSLTLKGSYGNGVIACSAPLKQQVFKWFRKQGYDTKVQKESEGVYFGFYWTGATWVTVGIGTYEDAESACIDKLIEIILKEKKS
jgi:hypothetical protein